MARPHNDVGDIAKRRSNQYQIDIHYVILKIWTIIYGRSTVESESQSWKHSPSRFSYNHFGSQIMKFLPKMNIVNLTLKTF